jgi:hypothetical protein
MMDNVVDALVDHFVIPTQSADEFEIIGCISTHIYQVMWKGIRVVVKRTPLDQAKSTIRLLQSITHPHVTKLLDFRQDTSFGYIIMENEGSVTLQETLASLSTQFLQIAVQLTSACQHMHERFVRHGSISTETIIISQTADGVKAKFISFGCASFTGFCDFRVKKQPQDPTFTAPEIITSSQATCAADIWSLGLVIFAMLSQKPPSTWGPDARTFAINNITTTSALNSPVVASAIRGCLRVQAKNRFSAAMLHSIIEELISPNSDVQAQPSTPLDAIFWQRPHAAAGLLGACIENPTPVLLCFDALLSHIAARWEWDCADSVMLLRAFAPLFGHQTFFTDQPPILAEQLAIAGTFHPEIVTNLWALLLINHHKTFVDIVRGHHDSVARTACLGACVAIESNTPVDPSITVLQSIEPNHPIAKLLLLLRAQLLHSHSVVHQAQGEAEAAIKHQRFLAAQLASIRQMCDNTHINPPPPPPPPPPS